MSQSETEGTLIRKQSTTGDNFYWKPIIVFDGGMGIVYKCPLPTPEPYPYEWQVEA